MVKTFDAVLDDRPDLFWLVPQFSSRTMRLGSRGQMILEQQYSNEEIAAIRTKAQQAVAATAGATPLETERKIVEYVVRNTEYAIDNERNQNMASALYYGKAQCSGIARAVKYLCDCHKIPCIVVSGEIHDQEIHGPHAWNIVQIDGKTYHLDVTTILGSNPNKSGQLFLPTFNCSDTQMSATYFWKRNEVPACPVSGATESAQNGAYAATQRTATHHKSYSSGANPTPQPSGTRIRPTPKGTQNNAPSAEEANLPHYTNLAALRAGLEEAIANKRKEISFVLTVGDSMEERQKLMANALKMVSQKMHVVASVRIEIRGNINTIIFQ